uniref:Glycosyl transferase n=1 Tax=Paulinella micropora TaxID=1928728 RepID=A0A385HZD7_9EUKA|nr:hypothetical protein PMNZ_059 [Paulinella micropora]AXY63022.1 hypothetical protein PMNZ_059 [Paulinella micropora]
MLVYVCISAHGFGHGSRQGAILSALHKLQPHWRLVISTSLPNTFLKLAMGGVLFEKRLCNWDVGIIQPSAIEADNEATSRALDTLENNLPLQVECESRWLRFQQDSILIVSDIPPAAASLARELNAPLVWIGNFGWDDIYSYIGKSFRDKTQKIRDSYYQGTCLIRLPFSMAMDWSLPEIQVGLTTSEPRLNLQNLGKLIGWHEIPERKYTILIGFGGLKLNDIHCQIFDNWKNYHFLIRGIEKHISMENWPKNVSFLPANIRLLDFMPLCSRMLTKPGYSSFCEAISQGLGLHVVNREGFAEVEVLERGLKAAGYYRFLGPLQFKLGEWELNHMLNTPFSSIPIDGADQAAWALVAIANKVNQNRFILK